VCFVCCVALRIGTGVTFLEGVVHLQRWLPDKPGLAGGVAVVKLYKLNAVERPTA
jgi:hypothetical protein